MYRSSLNQSDAPFSNSDEKSEILYKGSEEKANLTEKKYITIFSKRKEIKLDAGSILYIMMNRDKAKIHVSGNKVYETWLSLNTIEKLLGDEFIMVRRGCLVSAMAIHDITKKVNLVNGDSLDYPIRKKKQLIEEFRFKQGKIVSNIIKDDGPVTEEEYRSYYKSFDNLPFAFTDIEMVFDERKHAVDWIFRYGNQELSRLEKLPLEKLIGSSFRSLFSNMDSKWLRSYERAALYGEKLEMMDYSPEIDTYLKVICFPTFRGHCGCILFDLSDIRYMENSEEAKMSWRTYFEKQISKNA